MRARGRIGRIHSPRRRASSPTRPQGHRPGGAGKPHHPCQSCPRVATVKATFSGDFLGRNDVARDERCPEAVDDLGGRGDGRQALPPGRCQRNGCHACGSSRRQSGVDPSEFHPGRYPIAYVRFEPPDGARTEPHGLREGAVLDVLIDRAGMPSRSGRYRMAGSGAPGQATAPLEGHRCGAGSRCSPQ